MLSEGKPHTESSFGNLSFPRRELGMAGSGQGRSLELLETRLVFVPVSVAGVDRSCQGFAVLIGHD